ncbi:spore coat protein CotH [Paenibacillus sp. BIHB 4019]|uniref:Spore coat protein CotH n=1 Tax=Paenibacillus sp. BIHB 4019 TaxID=1870819 RepID=A0A1B2DLA3_9BACL|nr:CotH kinase family protein [Paenibacillus sp. BIHB 4019]ANY68479.1 spore coat protein CotH [Paenibacillus sp. BIHB 4019]
MKAKASTLLLSLCSLLLLLTITACTNGTGSTPTATETNVVSGGEQTLDETVFPKDKVIDVKITVDKDDFQNMLDNASAEEFKEATVDYNGQVFKNVGIRTKGNLSLSSVVNMTDSDRYSFKLSFDEYVNQTIDGISKINLNNNFSDASYMREFLSYELAEAMGLPTPKYSYVNVYVNGELWGFYLAIEQIGDAYLERNFGNSYGALYKANGGNGSELNWLETMKSYTGLDLKSASSNDDILLKMLDELNNGTDYDSVLDVQEALKFIALNAVAGNMDSYLSEKKHNYYLYEDDGLFSILPWDYNMSFGGFGGTGVLIDEPTSGTLADRPLIAKLLAVDEYKEQYHAIIKQMIEGYLADDTLAARVKEISEMISPYVKADPSSFYSYEEYEQGITTVLFFASSQVESVTQQLDGTIPSSGDGSGSGSSGFGGGGGGMGGGGGFPGGGNVPTDGANAEGGNPPTDGANAAGGNPPADGANAAGGNPPTDGANVAGNNPPADGANGAQQGGQGFGGGGFGGGGPVGQGGMGGQGGMMAPPNGMGGGGPGGQNTQPQGSASEAITAGIALIILILSSVFVIFYNRRRL